MIHKLAKCVVAFLLVSAISKVSSGAEEQSFIRVNQLGYRPADVKIALAMGQAILPAKFRVIDAATQQSAFESDVRAINEPWGQFQQHAELDFSTFDNAGEF